MRLNKNMLATFATSRKCLQRYMRQLQQNQLALIRAGSGEKYKAATVFLTNRAEELDSINLTVRASTCNAEQYNPYNPLLVHF